MPRFLHRWWASVAGYFWLPCPICGRMFGGHEKGGGLQYYAHGRAKITCPKCPRRYHLVASCDHVFDPPLVLKPAESLTIKAEMPHGGQRTEERR